MTSATLERARATSADVPAYYDGFDKMLLAGEWRTGRSSRIVQDLDPYTDDVLVEVRQADFRDLGQAFDAAAAAQPSWSASLPRARAAIIRRAAEIIETRRQEL